MTTHHPSKAFYDNWIEVLLRQVNPADLNRLDREGDLSSSSNPRYHVRPRGLRLTSTRGVAIHALDHRRRPILAFGSMVGGYSRGVVAPLFYVRADGSFALCVQDMATHNAFLWDDDHMFIRKVYYGSKKFFTFVAPYEQPNWLYTWQMTTKYPNPTRPDLKFQFVYYPKPLIYTYAHNGGPFSGTWFNFDMGYSVPRLILAPRTDDAAVKQWIKACEDRSFNVYKRLSRKVKAAGGNVRPVPFDILPPTLNVNTQALSQFVDGVDIYQTRPEMEALT